MARISTDNQRFQHIDAIHFIASGIGVFFGLFSSVNHGIFEMLQGNVPTQGLVINAIGEAQRFWVFGHEPAFTIMPTFMSAGILSVIVGIILTVWSIRYLSTEYGHWVYLGLFMLSFLVGGGIGQAFFFLPAWAFATRIGKPLTWWNRIIPKSLRPYLSHIWPVTLVLATLCITITLEIGIFGAFPGMNDPTTIQNFSMICMFVSIILFVMSFIAAIAHNLLYSGNIVNMGA
jgi:hypothetical protein